ncbi:MAG: class I SAM-dependent methyltransferase [Candidatus Kryptoniota bacterium]
MPDPPHRRQHGNLETKSRIADLLIKSMNLSKLDVVLDVGSGDGYYSLRFAEQCGKVMAIDEYCDGLKGDFYAKSNIETFCEDACQWFKNHDLTGVTHVFFSNSFHDMSCQDEILSALSDKLNGGAYLDLIEFHPETPFGPPKSIRFSKDEIRRKVESYYFEMSSFIDLDTHYFISFKKLESKKGIS